MQSRSGGQIVPNLGNYVSGCNKSSGSQNYRVCQPQYFDLNIESTRDMDVMPRSGMMQCQYTG